MLLEDIKDTFFWIFLITVYLKQKKKKPHNTMLLAGVKYSINILYIDMYFFGGTGVWTQGFVLAKQALWNYIFKGYYFVYKVCY
jgi:hypothetical protein